MRRKAASAGGLLLAAALALSACSGTGVSLPVEPSAPQEAADAQPQPSGDKTELTFWSYYDGWDQVIAKFTAKHPDVSVRLKVFAYDTYADAYLQSLADGDPPDIMMIDSNDSGYFNSIDELENLLEPPYSAGRYKDGFSPALWASSLSIDQRRLVSFPLATAPTVTYYRADIFKESGLPYEPEELGVYMENPGNWLHMATVLKEQGRWINQSSTDVIQMYNRTSGFFDSNYNFLRNNEDFRQAVDLSKKVNEMGLDANVDMWTPGGQEALRNGNLVMLYLGVWGADQIRQWAPETSGLWRETRLPFNLYGWQNSSNFALPSKAKHKEMAWKFIQYVVTESSMDGMGGSVPAYLPARPNPYEIAKENDFLGGQKQYPLHLKLAENMKEFMSTPIDKKVQVVWMRSLKEGIEKNISSTDILNNAERSWRAQYSRDIEILTGTP